jgi:hypothetical protein
LHTLILRIVIIGRLGFVFTVVPHVANANKAKLQIAKAGLGFVHYKTQANAPASQRKPERRSDVMR